MKESTESTTDSNSWKWEFLDATGSQYPPIEGLDATTAPPYRYTEGTLIDSEVAALLARETHNLLGWVPDDPPQPVEPPIPTSSPEPVQSISPTLVDDFKTVAEASASAAKPVTPSRASPDVKFNIDGFVHQQKHSTNDPGARNGYIVPRTYKMGRLCDMPDPYCCPLCYHAYCSASSVKEHMIRVHNYTLDQVEAESDVRHPKTLLYFAKLGRDNRYTGSESKQRNARRRWDAGMSASEDSYWFDVYKSKGAAAKKA